MTGIEITLSVLVSLFSNGITILADRKDAEERRRIQEALSQFQNEHSFPNKITQALKTIEIDAKEVDKFKKLLSNDLIAESFSNALLNQEDSALTVIVEDVSRCCGIDLNAASSFAPIIREFAKHFRETILSDSRYSPFLIIRAIEKDGEKTRKSMGEEHRRIENKLDRILSHLNDPISSSQAIGTANASTQESPDKGMSLPDRSIGVSESSRTMLILSEQLDHALDRLNQIFKSEAEEVRLIQIARDYRKAIEKYKSLLAKASPQIDQESLLNIYIDCALCCINLDEFSEADNWLGKGEQVHADNVRVMALRGLLYYETGQSAKAKDYVERARKKDPFYHISLMLETVMDLQNGLVGKEIANNKFLDKNGRLKEGFNAKHYAPLYRTVAQCFLHDKEFDEAIKYLDMSYSLDANDDYSLALLGHAYLEKTIHGKKVLTFDRQLIGEQRAAIETAITYFSAALDLALSHKNIRHHTSTYANLSTCYMLIGKYDTAFDVVNVNVSSLTESDAQILTKSKAAALFYSQRYDEASHLLSATKDNSCRDVINKALALLQTDPDSALKVIVDAINEKQFTDSEINELRFLKYEILLNQSGPEGAWEDLTILDTSELANWEKQVAWARYFAEKGEHDKATERFQTALESESMPLHVRTNIAFYYFTRGKHHECLDICSVIPIEEMNTKSDVGRQLMRMSVISLFRTDQIPKCRELIKYLKEQGVGERYLYEISASMYWQDDELEKARAELEILLRLQGEDKQVQTLCNAGMVCFLLCDLNKAEEYFSEAEQLDEFYKHSDFVINAIKAYIVMGNTIKAKQILEKTIEMRFEDKEDEIHKFALIFYLRENRASQFVKYAIAFNQKHGNVEWLWTKNIEKDKEELQALFDQDFRKATELKKRYLNHASSFPLAFMANLGARNSIVHVWRYNREYDLPIFLESGNAEILEAEISTLENTKSVVVDYTCLLALVDVDDKYLWLLNQCFDEIIIYRPMYIQILNELIYEEDKSLRTILNFLSSKKIRFVKEKTTPQVDTALPFPLKSNIKIYEGLFAIAKERNIGFIAGEERIRMLARTTGVVSSGIRSLFEHALKKDFLDKDSISEVISKLAQKHCQFISFNTDTLRWLFMNRSFEEAKEIFDMFRAHLFLGNSIIETFMNVYLQFFTQSINSGSQVIVSYFIKETVRDIKKFLTRARIFDKYSWPENWVTYTNLKNLNESCLLYVYRLALVIYAANLDESLKKHYLQILGTEANLEYWFTAKLRNQSVIHYLFSAAESNAKNFQELLKDKKKK